MSLKKPSPSEHKRTRLTYKVNKNETKMLKYVPDYLIERTARESSVLMNHKAGILLSDFKKNKKLKDFFLLISTSFDDNRVEYTSSMEAKNYPIFLTQYHPEKA